MVSQGFQIEEKLKITFCLNLGEEEETMIEGDHDHYSQSRGKWGSWWWTGGYYDSGDIISNRGTGVAVGELELVWPGLGLQLHL